MISLEEPFIDRFLKEPSIDGSLAILLVPWRRKKWKEIFEGESDLFIVAATKKMVKKIESLEKEFSQINRRVLHGTKISSRETL